ncbi:unnamed protein product [Cylindrotheca closterium]|uniref:Uncharacterized protein n=1 Tax=Cylindrotheca closterium TaxID=2856 RepID=A0AAD2G8Z4_9STRA|nr:unnamed protein product [Cylindrotheca closterium]
MRAWNNGKKSWTQYHVNLRHDFSKLNQEKLELTNFSNGLLEKEAKADAILMKEKADLEHSPEPIPPFLVSMNPSPVASTSSFTSAQPISSLKPPPVASQKPHSKHNRKA